MISYRQSNPNPTLRGRRSRPAAAAVLAGLALSLGAAAPAGAWPDRPSSCGEAGQRPCNLWEYIPSCDSGLVENFTSHACQSPGSPPASGCGASGNRPCRLWERIPSCDSGLTKNIRDDVCQSGPPSRPSGCGHQGQRPCNVTEFLPSCDTSLAESMGDPDLCQPVAAGQSPFLAGLGNLSQRYADSISDAQALCRSWMSGLISQNQSPPLTSQMPGLLGGMTAEGQCPAYIGAGFVCEAPALLELFTIPDWQDLFGSMEDSYNAQYNSRPCAQITDPAGRAACAAGMVVFGLVLPGGYATAQCFAKAVGSEAVWKAIAPGQLSLGSDKCMDVGAAMFELGMSAIESKLKGKTGANKDAAKGKFKARRDKKLAKAPPAARAKLEADAANEVVDNKNLVQNLLSMLGDAQQVASALAGIAECGPSAPSDSPILTPVPGGNPVPAPLESKVALRAWNGQYAAAEDTGAGTINANRADHGLWEGWTLVPLGGAQYALRSWRGKYLGFQVWTTNALDVADAIGPWEKLTLVNVDGGRTAIQASNGMYLRAIGDGGSGVAFDAAGIGNAEKWALVDHAKRAWPHDLCDVGAPLLRGDSAGISKVCIADPYCCDTAWDSVCVREMGTVAGQACFGQYTPGSCQAMSDFYGMSQGHAGSSPSDVQSYFSSLGCTTSPAMSACQALSDEYGLSPTSLGDAPPNAQAYYRTLGCTTRQAIGSACQRLADEYYMIPGMTNGFAPDSVLSRTSDMGCNAEEHADTCQIISNRYGTEDGVTWGFAPRYVQDWWIWAGCHTHPQGTQACQSVSNVYGLAQGATYGYAPEYVLDWWFQKGCSTTPDVDPSVKRTTCQLFSNEFGIDAGQTWGNAPGNVRSWWSSHGCDEHPQEPNSACQYVSDTYGVDHGVTSGLAPQVVQDWWHARGCHATPMTGHLCQSLSDRYGIDDGVTWGFAPQAAQDMWIAKGCHAHPTQANLCKTASNRYGISDQSPGFAPAGVQAWFTQNGCHTSPNLSVTCQLASDEYGIYGVSPGYAPASVQAWWSSVGCTWNQPRFSDSCTLYSTLYGAPSNAPPAVQSAWAALSCGSSGGFGPSCKAIHAQYPGLPSGTYRIDPDGGSADNSFQVFCDMTTDGGGWALVLQATGTSYAATSDAIGGAGASKTYRLEGERTSKSLYMQTSNAYVDSARGMNLTSGPIQACEATALAACSMTSIASPGTIDSLAWGLTDNGCDRFFTDYSQPHQCYAPGDSDHRCFNTGATCNWTVPIQMVTLWVRE